MSTVKPRLRALVCVGLAIGGIWAVANRASTPSALASTVPVSNPTDTGKLEEPTGPIRLAELAALGKDAATLVAGVRESLVASCMDRHGFEYTIPATFSYPSGTRLYPQPPHPAGLYRPSLNACAEESDAKTQKKFPDLALSQERQAQTEQLVTDFLSRFEASTDPVLSEWSDCMRASGFETASPVASRAAIRAKANADGADLKAVRAEEIAVARADAACEQALLPRLRNLVDEVRQSF